MIFNLEIGLKVLLNYFKVVITLLERRKERTTEKE